MLGWPEGVLPAGGGGGVLMDPRTRRVVGVDWEGQRSVLSCNRRVALGGLGQVSCVLSLGF